MAAATLGRLRPVRDRYSIEDIQFTVPNHGRTVIGEAPPELLDHVD
jgi:hypothetical protein